MVKLIGEKDIMVMRIFNQSLPFASHSNLRLQGAKFLVYSSQHRNLHFYCVVLRQGDMITLLLLIIINWWNMNDKTRIQQLLLLTEIRLRQIHVHCICTFEIRFFDSHFFMPMVTCSLIVFMLIVVSVDIVDYKLIHTFLTSIYYL